MTKSIKQVAEERATHRRACRDQADALLEMVLERVDKAPREQQLPIISMLITELQIATRQSEKPEDKKP